MRSEKDPDRLVNEQKTERNVVYLLMLYKWDFQTSNTCLLSVFKFITVFNATCVCTSCPMNDFMAFSLWFVVEETGNFVLRECQIHKTKLNHKVGVPCPERWFSIMKSVRTVRKFAIHMKHLPRFGPRLHHKQHDRNYYRHMEILSAK